ncbi:MAG: efflux RND transporter periplasmic adaptor subunit [Gammaproteobacteria bacterium]|nr:efflux RND transporter periplasmic adaptor subunit [Gammaproteobacteria bacterium]NND36202.1 efflux RND transporter periplasmic adaptor subunit [Gammaproteobacteria bacterium]
MGKWILLAIVAVAATAAYAFLTRSKPVIVTVIEVDYGDVVSTVSNTRAGTVDACRRAGMSPALGGQIAKLPVHEGDAVEAGQVMLELWNDDLRAELQLAKRDAIASRGRRDEVCTRAEVAQQEARRLSSLLEKGLAAEEATARAVGEAKAQKAACAASNDAALVSDARIEVAKARLERTLLRAPFDGIIAEINGELGEFVTPSPVGIATPPTVDLIDSKCLYISAPIDEVDAPAISAGQKASITMDAFPNQKFPGFVRRVAPYVLDTEKQARTVEIEAEIENPDSDRLLPGYSADVEIVLQTRKNVLRIPTQTIVDATNVYVFENDSLAKREIEIGVRSWEYAEILSGLNSGEQVVLTVDREGVEDGATATVE